MGRSKKERNQKRNMWQTMVSLITILCMIGFGYITQNLEIPDKSRNVENKISSFVNVQDLSQIPEYVGNPYIEVNGNIPYFEEDDNTTKPFENYSNWDNLGRSGVAFANISKETMPKKGEERGEIGSVNDLSGWVQKRYDDKIKDKYLYNRCHLIGWQLSRRKCQQTKSNYRNKIPKYPRHVTI